MDLTNCIIFGRGTEGISIDSIQVSRAYALVGWRCFLEIVHKDLFLGLASLFHHHSSNVVSLAFNLGESPDLTSSPSVLDALDIGIDNFGLQGLGKPVLLKELLVLVVVLEVADLDPFGRALDVAEDVVLVIGPLSVEIAQLRGAFDSCGAGLRDVDVHDTLIIRVFLDYEGNSHKPNCLTDEPIDSLLLIVSRDEVGLLWNSLTKARTASVSPESFLF
jgi:hypothetical protein